MDNVLVKALPPMLTGSALDEALPILPEYDPNITTQDAATRLVALHDGYQPVGISVHIRHWLVTWNIKLAYSFTIAKFLSHIVSRTICLNWPVYRLLCSVQLSGLRKIISPGGLPGDMGDMGYLLVK
jgi:hypothetical protein